MQNTKTDELIKELTTLSTKGAKFLTINGYINQKGEKSNYMVIANFSYENAKNKDVKKLEGLKYKDQLREEARQLLLESFIKNKDKETSSNQSKAQKEAYTVINNCIKIHNETKKLYLYGKVVKKDVIEKTNYKETVSDEITIAKNKIKKKLHTPKYRQFILTEIKNIKVNGKEIIVEL